MTVASPLARQYYFMWLFFPMTILIHRAAYDPRPAVRTGTWIALAIAGLLMCLSLPIFPNDLQACGNNLAATADDWPRAWSGTSCIRPRMAVAPCLDARTSYKPSS